MASEKSAFVPCPLCGMDAAAEVQQQTLALPELGTVPIGFGYCGACGHIYQTRPAPPDVLGRHYASFSNYTCFNPETARAAPPSEATRRLLSLAKAQAAMGTIYEIGCATGYHLSHFRRAGWTVGGCDLSPKAVAQAEAIFGIAVDCGADVDVLPGRSNVDAVLLSHVLEHLQDPLRTLLLAHAALRDGGALLLEVPCAIAPERLPPGWFSFEHLHYFSQSCLLHLLEAAGFSPVETRITFNAQLLPVITIAAIKADPGRPRFASQTTVAEATAFLDEAVSRDDKLWARTAHHAANVSGPFYVWGAGVHTAQLFDRASSLDHNRITAIVDRDSQKWGLTQAGHEIIGPDDFFSRRDDSPILISSFAAEPQIAHALAAKGITQDRIVRLYG